MTWDNKKAEQVIKVFVEDARDHERIDHATLVSIIHKIGDKIMSAISDFAAKQTAFNDRVSKALDGITTDIDTLNALILKLQTTPGPISPEDQATLDQAQAQGEALSAKAEALDALTPPTPPAA